MAHRAESLQRQAVVAAEQRYDAAAGTIEQAWQKVFSLALKSSFQNTHDATLENNKAIQEWAMFEQGQPFIEKEIPPNLPGLMELLVSMRQQPESRRIETCKNLSAAHEKSARAYFNRISRAKVKKAKDLATANGRLEKTRAAAAARLRQAIIIANAKLNKANADAQLLFDATSAVRKKAWDDYLKAAQSAEQQLPCLK